MNQNPVEIEEDEIDIREIFRTVFHYKYMIISLVILFTLASAVYAYFKPNIYQASSTVEISPEKWGAGGSDDVLAMAMDPGSVNSDTEIVIAKSVSMTERALKYVDFAHRYYTTRRYKQVELYKGSPFQVGMLKGYGIKFNVIPMDEKTYRLTVEETKDKNRHLWSYDKVHEYSKEIVTDHFHLNVIRTKEEMKDERYHFIVIDPLKVARSVRANVSVSQEGKYANVLNISYTDNVPLRTQEFTNALAKAYVERSVESKIKEADLKLSFIEKHLKRINDDLKSSALKLEEFKRSSNTVDLSAKAQKIIGQMGTFEIQLTEIAMSQKMLNTLYENIKSGNRIESVSIDGITMAMDQASSLSIMIKQLQDAIVSKKRLRQDYTEVYPSVRGLNKEIEELKSMIISTIKNLMKSVADKQVLLEKSIAEQQKLLNTLPADERVYGELERKFAVNEKMYSYLLEKQSETAIIKASTLSKNVIIDKAFLPGAPIKPKKKLIVLVGMIFGLILGIALAFLRAFLNDKIKSEEDVERGTSVPLLGFIPNIKEDAGKIKVFSSSRSALTEAFRNLRTNLEFMPHRSGSHVISITSTVGAEGKTTISTNLGAIMSMSKNKTIVLNLDMRKPTLHEKFDLPNTKGMSNLLSGNTNLGSVIQHTEYDHLDVITSGPVPPNPSELIQSALIEKILVKLREIYDVIILDTPPIGLVADARILMQFSDTNIYVVRADYSKKDFLRNVERLSKEDIKGLAILLNDVKMDNSGYGYGYGYYEEDK